MTEAMHSYTVSGLSVDSEISLPGLLARASEATPPDVTIRRGVVPATLADAQTSRPTWELAGDRFLLRIPGIARFLLTCGRSIVFEAEAGSDDADLSAFLLGTAMGILLHQRGHIVLHASATNVNGKAVLFCGPSGAGKSTLAAALTQRGFACITDDLCAVSVTGGEGPTVHSDGRQLKLWAHAIERLRLSSGTGSRVRRQLEKYYVDHGGLPTESLPLGAVYVLREARPPHVPGIERPNVVDRALLVRQHAYRPLLVRRMAQRERYFRAAATIGNTAGVFHLTRILDFAAMPDCLSMLERHWSEIGLMRGGS